MTIVPVDGHVRCEMLVCSLVSGFHDCLSKQISEVFFLNEGFVSKCVGLLQEEIHLSICDRLLEIQTVETAVFEVFLGASPLALTENAKE